MINAKTKLIVIVGPTASGKTELALNLAEQFNGEIICADSRTIYRGMDIGTAKPTAAEQARVRHHLLDVVDPGETLSVAEFKRLAEAAIADIAGRGKVPLLVGGSGLYIDAVVLDYKFPGTADLARRAEYEAMPSVELLKLLKTRDPEAYKAVDQANRRRVIRALETVGMRATRQTVVPGNVLMLGLLLNKEVIQYRIRQRIEKMLGKGFIREVAEIGQRYGFESEAFTAIGYRTFRDVVLGTKSIEAATEEFVRGDTLLVKKQLTWFRRNPQIQWLDDPVKAKTIVRDFLAK